MTYSAFGSVTVTGTVECPTCSEPVTVEARVEWDHTTSARGSFYAEATEDVACEACGRKFDGKEADDAAVEVAENAEPDDGDDRY